MDGTGACHRDDNNESIACTVIPGAVIDCRDKQKLRYECVSYGIASAGNTQLAFSCTRHLSTKINDSLFNNSTINPDKTEPPPAATSDTKSKSLPKEQTDLKPQSPAPQSTPPANPFVNGSGVF